MAFLKDAQKSLNEDSPFFRAEVLKEYTFKIIRSRKLKEGDNLYDGKGPKWEFTLLDMETGKEKTWTTGGQAIRDMVEQEIDEGDVFMVIKTGEVGKGKKYWRVRKGTNSMPEPQLNNYDGPMDEPVPDFDEDDTPLDQIPL